jgi:hypothetical protein
MDPTDPQTQMMVQALIRNQQNQNQPGMGGGINMFDAMDAQNKAGAANQQPGLGAEFMPQGMLGQMNAPPGAPMMQPPPDSPY